MQGKGEPTAQRETTKPSQNPYSLPNQSQRKKQSLSLFKMKAGKNYSN